MHLVILLMLLFFGATALDVTAAHGAATHGTATHGAATHGTATHGAATLLMLLGCSWCCCS